MSDQAPGTNVKAMEDEHQLRLLIDSVTNCAIYMLDAQGRVVTWNSGAERIKQYTAAEIIGQHFSKFYTESERKAGEPTRALAIAREKGKYEATGWHIRKDGSRFLADVIIQPVRDRQGKLLGYAKLTRDVTERYAIEQKIREGAMMKALFDTAVDVIMMIDAYGTIQMANPACETLFGYKPEEIVSQNVRILIPSFNNEAKPIASGHEVIGRRKNGTAFPMCLSVGEAGENGDTAYVAIMHDLSDRKRTEEQLVQAQKMETVGQLSGGIAHDFNNLLTVIIGNADLLAEGLRSRADLKQLCDTILCAGERGAELTRRLLAFSRKQTLQPAVVDCGKLVENMRMILRRTLSEDIDIRISADSDLAKAYADPVQLESAILNLALNARDAMPIGGHLVVTMANAALDEAYSGAHPEVRPGHYVMIAVTDDGEGMSPEVRERVFEPFFTTKEVGKGSGLGLSMVYGFVKQSNGHVAVYSEQGLGTTVRLYLPVAETISSEIEARPTVDLSTLEGHEVVLVVEDDPFVRSHAVNSLESFGYAVITATDGRSALAKLSSDTPIDILFSDIVMPGGMSGWELAEQARKLKPNLKILLTSGYPMETLTSHSRHDPSLPVLNKPYRKVDLGKRIREILETGPHPLAAPSTLRAASEIWH
jgi:PAS domain S-box-containing protein